MGSCAGARRSPALESTCGSLSFGRFAPFRRASPCPDAQYCADRSSIDLFVRAGALYIRLWRVWPTMVGRLCCWRYGFTRSYNANSERFGLDTLCFPWVSGMPCWFPVPVFRAATPNESGKRSLITNPVKSIRSTAKQFRGCGYCDGCKLDKARDWTTRLVHEAQMHEFCWFLTFTYDDQHVPVSYSASKRDLQLLNMRIQEFYGRGVRYHVVSDYSPLEGGSANPFRPHYHGGYFGFDIPDLKKWSKLNGYQTWVSAQFSKLWPFGYHLIGSLTTKSMGYVARHNMDRVLGPDADEHYFRQSPVDGQFYRVETEFALMSRRPGIGGGFYDKFKGDLFPADFVVADGRPVPVPRYYRDRLARELDAKAGPPEPGLRGLSKRLDVQMKRKRTLASMAPGQVANRTPDRLRVRHQVQLERLKRLKRTL